MSRGDFWQLIDDLIATTDGLEEFEVALDDHLTSLSANDIKDFAQHYAQLQNEANTTGILEAACIIGCGESNDGFMDFRRWIVFQGKSAFEEILADPDCLGEYSPGADPIEHWYTEYDPMGAYEEATGEDLPHFQIKVYPDERSDFDKDDVLSQRYPKLWRRCKK